MNRIQAISYTLKHRKKLNEIAKAHGFWYPFHDVDKLFLYLLFGKKRTHTIHRLYSKHHERLNANGLYEIKDQWQAIFDWESSRFTKKDKPMTAYEYWLKTCPEIDLLFKMGILGFLPKNKSIAQIKEEIAKAKEKRFLKIAEQKSA